MGAAAAAIGAGGSLLGGLLQGIGSQGMANMSKEMQTRAMKDQEGQYADWLAGQMQLGGLRDQATYQLMNQLMQGPQSFNPVNYGAPANSGQQGLGGYNLNQEAQHAGQYTPGAGGTNTNVDQATLGMMGYNTGSDVNQANNPGSTNYNYAGVNYANGQGPLAAQTQGLGPGYTLSSGTSQWSPAGGHPAGNNYGPGSSWGQGAPSGILGITPGSGASQYPSAPYASMARMPGQGASSATIPGQWSGFSYGGGSRIPSGPGTSGAGSWNPGMNSMGGFGQQNPNQWPNPNRQSMGSNQVWG